MAHKKPSLQDSALQESKKFEKYYLWIEKHLPPSFFEDADSDAAIFIAHSLIGFDLQNYFSQIHFKNRAIVLSLDVPDADLQILKHYRNRVIRNYRTFVSNEPPPFPLLKACLKVTLIYFTELEEKQEEKVELPETSKELFAQVKKRNPDITEPEFKKLLENMNSRFLRSLTKERLLLAFDVLFRAKLRDPCQYEIRYNEDWEKKKETPSLQIVLAWRNVPKHAFLYRLAKVVYRNNLVMKRMVATYISSFDKQHMLVMSLGLHGAQGKAAWEEADIEEFLQELVTFKYFPGQEVIESTFVDTKLLSGNLGNLLKTMASFIHQTLVYADPNLYSLTNIEEALCRHPELTLLLTSSFEHKFHPVKHHLSSYQSTKEKLLSLIDQLDTGNELNDTRRKNVLKQGLNFIEFCLKTNFYRKNKTAFSFRLDPRYLNNVPYDRTEKFPELPFGIFFIKGFYYIGFHIRFRDLARGGLRTVYPAKIEQLQVERNNLFSECYNLALTQQKKNKDIPEGGAKGVILLEPYDRLLPEEEIYKYELENADLSPETIKEKMSSFQSEQKIEFLYQSQRSYIESFVCILNCEPDGTLRPKLIVDYYKKPEYIYLGPDENMHDQMIVWISDYAKRYDYKPGTSFMTSKPGAGINHKQFGVTSCGVNVYMEEILHYLGIDPSKEVFTLKMTGGPDGDVAGNQMYNLYKFFPKTAKLLSSIDVSGTIYDPEGLDLKIIATLFKEGKPLRFYPPEKLSDGSLLLDLSRKRQESTYSQQTLCYRKKGGKLIEDWLSGNEMNHIFRMTVLQTKADIFIPGGGRPRTLNDSNYQDFLDESGKPTTRAIVEGANLYLTPGARRHLEDLGVIIIKDSSANKGGVICSSFEVLTGLLLSEKEFLDHKEEIVQEILATIKARAKDEARVLLEAHGDQYLTEVSDEISKRINKYTDELLGYLTPLKLPADPRNPLMRCLIDYCLPLLHKKYADRIMMEIPDIHKKAMIACFLGQRLVYRRGLEWSPSVVDILPLITADPEMVGSR